MVVTGRGKSATDVALPLLCAAAAIAVVCVKLLQPCLQSTAMAATAQQWPLGATVTPGAKVTYSVPHLPNGLLMLLRAAVVPDGLLCAHLGLYLRVLPALAQLDWDAAGTCD
jgi:hypothetical protein